LSTAAILLNADALESIRKAPELSFIIPSRGQTTLAAYRGKVIALEFIQTTCPHCKAASHLMSKLQTEYGNRGLQVLDVAINPNADLLIDDFAKEQQVTFPVGWTTMAQMQAFMGFSDGRFVVPQLVLIDRAGNIHWQTPPIATQGNDWDKLMAETSIRQHIEQLLASPHTASVSH
jgi:thiol-disulfide isomerase/thioredoxin